MNRRLTIASFVAVTSLASVAALVGCARGKSSPSAESEIKTAAYPQGLYEMKASPEAVFHEGDVFHAEIGKYKFDDHKPYLVLWVVSPLCGKSCTGKWVGENGDSVDQYELDDVKVDEAKNTVTGTYAVGEDDKGNELKKTRTFVYANTAQGLDLREGAAVFKLATIPEPPKADPNALNPMRAALKALTEKGDESVYDELPIPTGTMPPMAIQREAHFWDQLNGDYPATIRLMGAGGFQFWAVDQNNDGGGSTDFYTKEGSWVNSFGGGESTDWEWQE